MLKFGITHVKKHKSICCINKTMQWCASSVAFAIVYGFCFVCVHIFANIWSEDTSSGWSVWHILCQGMCFIRLHCTSYASTWLDLTGFYIGTQPRKYEQLRT